MKGYVGNSLKLISDYFGKCFSFVVNPLLYSRLLLKFYNVIFNLAGPLWIRFFIRYITLPPKIFLWNIRLANEKICKTIITKNNPLLQQFALSYRWHSPNINLLELLINNCLPKRAPWIDIGSNLGLRYLLPLSDGRYVYFIEPNKEVNKLNKERCILNSYTTYTFIEVGVSDQTGYAEFYYDKTSYNSSLEKSILENDKIIFDRKEKIRIDTIDNIFREKLNDINAAYIKIDVEGHELNVIKGASRFISKILPSMIIEVNEKGDHFNQFIKLLSAYRYKIFEISDYQKGKFLSEVRKNSRNGYDVSNINFLVTKDENLLQHIRPFIS
jgi:FkbM family methyltransferase